jgi:uncharacterized protein YciI
MNYYALIYYYVEDYLTRRTQFREEHLKRANDLHNLGQLILAGVFSDPPYQALLIFKVQDKSVIEDFIKNDPYVKNGIVTKWEIKEMMVGIGNK